MDIVESYRNSVLSLAEWIQNADFYEVTILLLLILFVLLNLAIMLHVINK